MRNIYAFSITTLQHPEEKQTLTDRSRSIPVHLVTTMGVPTSRWVALDPMSKGCERLGTNSLRRNLPLHGTLDV